MSDYLASGFQSVDESDNISTYLTCLQRLSALDFFQQYKEKSYELMDLRDGHRVLDVGCGLGVDAMAIAERIGKNGRVIGIDSSSRMIDEAKANSSVAAMDNLDFFTCDGASLPFDDASFDRVRIDRMLQHIPDPALVFAEMQRVLKPSGLLVIFDNDWETFSLSASNKTVTRSIANYWCDSFPSGWIGRYLRKYLTVSQFTDIKIYPQTLTVTELEIANQVFDLFQTIERVLQMNKIDAEEAKNLRSELVEQDCTGQFFCSYTGFLVVARG